MNGQERMNEMKQSLNDDDSQPLVVTSKVSHGYFVLQHLLQFSAVTLYFVVATILPIYTNELSKYYRYPVTGTTLQVGGALVALGLVNLGYWIRHRNDLVPKSHIFKNFLWKNAVAFPASVLFSLVIALTNISIYNSPLDLHVLLKATDIVWIVILAWIIEREVPRLPVIVCVLGLVGGTIMLSYSFSTEMKSAAKILTLNLFTFFCQALTIVTVRKVVTVLKRREPSIMAHEITLIKIWQSFVLLLLPTYLIEEFHGITRFGSGDTVYLLVAAGVLLTAIYQTTVVGLTFFSLATTVGILGQITIVPQTILAMVLPTNNKLSSHFKSTPLHITGIVVVILFALGFGVVKYVQNRREYSKTREFLIPKAAAPTYGINNYDE